MKNAAPGDRGGVFLCRFGVGRSLSLTLSLKGEGISVPSDLPCLPMSSVLTAHAGRLPLPSERGA